MDELDFKIEEVKNKIDILKEKNDDSISDLEFELDMYLLVKNNNPIISNGIVDLYLYYENKFCSDYRIFLSDTYTYVGEIQYYQKLTKNKELGNVGFHILPNFRGNHYALDALTLMTDIIYQSGDTEIFIAAEKDNIPSIRTIESFGGIINYTDNFFRCYRCDLEEIKENKRKKV